MHPTPDGQPKPPEPRHDHPENPAEPSMPMPPEGDPPPERGDRDIVDIPPPSVNDFL